MLQDRSAPLDEESLTQRGPVRPGSATVSSPSPRQVLRHIGNAEQWYVSRLVPPDELPAEWDDDENLHWYEFLKMERETALACLRKLTDQQRSEVFFPKTWTRNPDEPWTVRKVVRRFLEHEREHIEQIRDSLVEYHAKM